MDQRSLDDPRLKVKNFLTRLPLFANLADHSIEKLARSGKFIRVGKGDFIFFQDDPSQTVFVVRTGLVSIILESQDGRRLVINEMHGGDFFGEVGILTGQSRSSTAIARSDCELVVFPGSAFLELLNGEPHLVQQLLVIASNRLRESSEREGALAFLDARGRLARLLLQLSHRELEKGYITISQEELAERTGQTRQTVAKALGQWRRGGWLITGRGRIMLLNYKALSQVEQDTFVPADNS